MKETFYPFTQSDDELRYEFVSISAAKTVRKVVLLSKTEEFDIYNLALLDVLEDGELSDTSETNNNDLQIVIATVFQIISNFLLRNSDCYVMFRGSDLRRQRLYRIIINKELSEISKHYEILGVKNGRPIPFRSDIEFDFYLIGKL